MKTQAYKKLEACVASVRRKTDFAPKIAVVLGSGLGEFANTLENPLSISYSEIENFPVSTAPGHVGRFVFGYSDGVPVVAMQGRIHYYEGYSMQDVVLPIRLMHLLGAEILFVTNASGGINKDFLPGDFMLIDDHISLFVPSPLIGANIEQLGVRFPDMTRAYDPKLKEAVIRAAKKQNIDIKRGVYVQLTGPSYESPAEITMLRGLGADAVGMSTVCEVIAARHMGMNTVGISCVSNAAACAENKELTHNEVLEMMNNAAPKFVKLLQTAIKEIGNL